MASEARALTVAYDLTLWCAERVSRFPKRYQHTVGQRMLDTLLDVQGTLVEANYRRERAALLRDVNLQLEKLRVLVRLAKDLRCLAISQYEFAAKQIDVVGRLVGGWLRRAKQ